MQKPKEPGACGRVWGHTSSYKFSDILNKARTPGKVARSVREAWLSSGAKIEEVEICKQSHSVGPGAQGLGL